MEIEIKSNVKLILSRTAALSARRVQLLDQQV
jgi:hypothetical protein